MQLCSLITECPMIKVLIQPFFLLFFCILQLGPGYSGSSVGVPESSSHVSLSSRHSSMLGGSQEAEVGGYRGHTSTAPHYGGQYTSVYGSAALSGAQQVSGFNSIVYKFFLRKPFHIVIITTLYIYLQRNN